MIGINSPNWSRFPEDKSRTFFAVGVGKQFSDTTSHWQSYYNFPSLSFSFFYSDLGSPILGKEVGIVPQLTINLSKKRKLKSFYGRLGLGMSYASNPFDSLSNPGNEILGAQWNWMFQIFLYRTLFVNNNWHVKLGLGGLHTSNSHTELPNFGLNSGMITLSAQYFSKGLQYGKVDNWRFRPNRKRIYFVQIYPGIGIHELGGTRRPINGPNKIIPNITVAGGIIYKQHLKVKAGLSYRYYDSFRDEIVQQQVQPYVAAPVLNASQIHLIIGAEFLLGHIGMELESGITLFKPYFDEWYRTRAEADNDFALFQNKTFPNRIGANVYLINTNKNPTHNVFAGLHVNANWGTADFMGYTFGYVRRFKN